MKYKDRIDPELRPFARNIPYWKAMIPCANVFQTVSFRFTGVPKNVTHRTLTLEGYRGLKLKVHLFEPSGVDEKLPCLIDIHGGAFSYRACAHHKKLACMIAAQAMCRVFFPDYHLAPRYPYPAAYEDVVALYKYILANEQALKVDCERIGVAGDSAGACIAASVCNGYERLHLKRPCVQMLVYPVTDAAMQTDSMKTFSDTPLWNAQNNRRMWAYYAGKQSAGTLLNASPMYDTLPSALPYTYIETAEYDCLHDEGVLYGERLRQTGAVVEMNETKGTFHGYDLALKTRVARCNIQKRILFLNRAFRNRPPV